MRSSKYRYRPIGSLGSTLVVMLIVDIVLTVLTIISIVVEINLLTKVQAGEFVSPQTLEANDAVASLLGLLVLGYLIALGIVFAKWIYRASANAHALSPTDMTISPVWCLVWYLIPFANLYKPFEGLKEVWQVSAAQPGQSPADVRAPLIMRVWWGLWLLAGFVGTVSSLATTNAITIESMLPAAYLAGAYSVISIMLSLSALSFVRRMTAVQAERRRARLR